MLLLLPILILLITAFAMLIVWRGRRVFAYYWVIAAGGAILAWVSLWVLRARIPFAVELAAWQPDDIFSSSPQLLADAISWPFAMALGTLTLAVILTDVRRAVEADWRTWAGTLALGGLGILAVLAGNIMTLVMAWVVIDILELLILLPRVWENETRQGVINHFSTSLMGVMLLLWADVSVSATGQSLGFLNISSQAGLYLLLAAGLRVGVLPLHVPFIQELPLRRGLGTMTRLISPAASLVLLARLGAAGVVIPGSNWLLGLILFSGLYGAIAWARATSELGGRPYWILGMTSLAAAAVIQGDAAATLSFGLALIYAGGAVFLAAGRHLYMAPIAILALGGISMLPGSPTAVTSGIFGGGINLLLLGFLFVQGILLLGFIRHASRTTPGLEDVARWVWVVYAPGLALLPIVHWVATIWLAPGAGQIDSPILWWPGVAGFALAGIAWLAARRLGQVPEYVGSLLETIFSLNWFYVILGRLYTGLGKVAAFISGLLEGQGGVLWAMVLVALLLSLLTQLGAGAGG